ncbi:MAG: pentapeptide repeat-containing protein, partial [Xenococcus sp. (in: cyanobacteria)]
MIEESSQYNPRFETAVDSAVVGENNIIYNYFYYREDIRKKPLESEEVTDEQKLPCPYRGLFHFGPGDADIFFGREVFVEQLFQATQTRNFISVLGASGSGKSSVVLAGLVPKLEEEGHWKFTHFRPGSDPFHSLALALVPLYKPELDDTEQIAQARKLANYLKEQTITLSDVFARIQQNCLNHRILLIADQFEELYTQCSDEIVRRRFLDCLLTSFPSSTASTTSSTVLVATMRVDFLSNALSYRRFADMLQNSDLKLSEMNREELSQAIEKPAEILGVRFEAGLVERILDDVENEPGNLPLLEFALTELWKKRKGKQLTHEAYEAVGQVQGALADYADDKYHHLSPAEQEQVRRIFIQLVLPGETTEDTRRLAYREEFAEENWYLITRKNGLADNRLVVTGQNEKTKEETVEIIHESLLTNWKKLKDWIETNRERIKERQKITIAAHEWRNQGRKKDYLFQGRRLTDAVIFAKESSAEIPLSKLEQEFIKASRNQKWKNNFKLFMLLGIPILIVLGIIEPFFRKRAIDENLNLVKNGKATKTNIEYLVEGCHVKNRNRIPKHLANFLFGNCLSLAGYNFEQLNLSQANLRGADLRGTKLSKAILTGADLTSATLSKAEMEETNFEGAKLINADLSNSFFVETNLTNANLSNAELSNTYFYRASLNSGNLSDANLNNCQIRASDLPNANLARTNITNCLLLYNDFTNVDWSTANLSNSKTEIDIPEYDRVIIYEEFLAALSSYGYQELSKSLNSNLGLIKGNSQSDLISESTPESTNKQELFLPLKWRTPIGVNTFRTTISLANGQIVVGSNGESRSSINDTKDGVYLIDSKTGRIIRHIPNETGGDSDINGIAIYKNYLFFGSDNNRIFSYDFNGVKNWSFATDGDVEGAPSLSDITGDAFPDVLLATENGTVYALNGKSGKQIWRFQSQMEAAPGKYEYLSSKAFMSSPAVFDINEDGVRDVLIGGRNAIFYALDGKTGSVIWKYHTGSGIHSSSMIVNMRGSIRIILAESYADIHILDKNGNLLNKQTLDAPNSGLQGLFSSPIYTPFNQIVIGSSWFGRNEDDGFWIIPYGNTKIKQSLFFGENRITATPLVADI